MVMKIINIIIVLNNLFIFFLRRKQEEQKGKQVNILVAERNSLEFN